MSNLVQKIANEGLRKAISEYGLDPHPEIIKATVRTQWEQYIEESIRIAQDIFERDRLGLTQPPPDLSHRWNILEGHGPDDADVWDDRPNAWTFCFAVYRKVVCRNSDREIADMLCHRSTGSVVLKHLRLHTTRGNDGRVAYRYVKFSQNFVDNWVDAAMNGLYALHGDEEYASSLLPWDLLR
ncbi:MAG: hypothetical protein OXU36_14760 [Candidatus Poribacteria bacterium]|nr:hypothetical protein [Candidatus Poribacteria bacterium]